MDTIIKLGSPLPDFSLPDLTGTVHTFADYRGRITALVFWSAECPWSTRADESLSKMQAEWGDEVAILLIASNATETREEIEKAAAERSVKVLLLDEGAQFASQLGATITPEVFVADREGILRYKGAFDDANFRQPEPTCNHLWEAIENMLADENPVPGEIPAYGCTIVKPPTV
jgi:peroxiredoxin